MLQLTYVKKYYWSRLALSVDDLSIHGGIYWLKGTNGSGKTTLLKLLAGILPYQGKLQLQGTDEFTHRTAYRKLIGYGEAEPLYPSFLTGNDLVALYTHIKGKSETDELADRFEINRFTSAAVRSYSSGMVKKLSLVLALTGYSKMILLDEPLITLDTKAVLDLCQHLRERSKNDSELIILFSSHQIPPADELPIKGCFLVDQQTVKNSEPS